MGWMANIRMIPLYGCCSFFVLAFCFLGCLICYENRLRRSRNNGDYDRVDAKPSLLDVIREKGHKFSGLADDDALEECPICFEPFKVDDDEPVAELKCSDKHIFHVKCLSLWIENNHSRCPICRAPIE